MLSNYWSILCDGVPMTISEFDVEPENELCDFEFLVALAKNDPVEFERIREKTIRDFINSTDAAKQEMLNRFQWRIDQTRRQASNPLHALIKISQMMWDSLDSLGNAQSKLRDSERESPPVENNEFKLIRLADYRKQR